MTFETWARPCEIKKVWPRCNKAGPRYLFRRTMPPGGDRYVGSVARYLSAAERLCRLRKAYDDQHLPCAGPRLVKEGATGVTTKRVLGSPGGVAPSSDIPRYVAADSPGMSSISRSVTTAFCNSPRVDRHPSAIARCSARMINSSPDGNSSARLSRTSSSARCGLT